MSRFIVSRFFAIAALSALIVVPAIAAAQTGTDTTRADRRQAKQEKRIDQGVSSGQLNKRETARLEKGQNRVDRIENRAQDDGTVTKRERRRVEKAQDVQSKRIYRQKHDNQTRG